MLETIGDMTGTTIYELVPSVSVIKRMDDGVINPPTISCGQVKIVGNNPPEPSNKTITYETSEMPGFIQYYAGSIPVGDWDWIMFYLSDGGIELDRQRVLVLRNGLPATIYELVPSVNAVKRTEDNFLIPYIISCSQQSVTGVGDPEPSYKTIKYITSQSDIEKSYSGGWINLDTNWKWIEFRLYDDGKLLDVERVPILYDGISAMYIDIHNSNISIPCDEDGIPVPGFLPYTTQAVLYHGNQEVEQFIQDIDHYPGSPIEPDLWSGFHDQNIRIKWMIGGGLPSYSVPYPGEDNLGVMVESIGISGAPNGITIDDYGVITIAPDANLEDFNEIEVVAYYNRMKFVTILTIQKAKAAESPVMIGFDNQNRLLACDSGGQVKNGQLPMYIQASLYRGVRDITLNAVWELINPVSGVQINNGVITIYPSAELGINNEIKIQALWRDMTFTASAGVVKVLDGPG
jgi:hypothetical protein